MSSDWSNTASYGGYGSKAGLDSAISSAAANGTGGLSQAGGAGGGGSNRAVYGVNPSTGSLEVWGSPSRLGGIQTTAAGYRAGRNLGRTGAQTLSATGLSDRSHSGFEDYQNAHRAIRNTAINSGFATAENVQGALDDYLGTHINLGTMTMGDAEKIQDDVAAGNYDKIPDHVKSNVDIAGLEEAVNGNGRYDSGINDMLAVMLSPLGVDLQTPQSFYERQRQGQKAGEEFGEKLARTYAPALGVKAATSIVASELSNPLAAYGVSTLGGLAANSVMSPGTTLKLMGDATEAANIHEIEVARGFAEPENWSQVPDIMRDASAPYYAENSEFNNLGYAAEEDPVSRLQRWKILQARQEADPTDSFGLGYIA